MKKFLSLILALTLCVSMSVTAFAEGPSDIPELEKTTITYDVPAAEEDDDGIEPLIWGQETHEPNVQTRYTTPFVIPDRYFAYEVTATSGNPNGECAVALMNSYMWAIASETVFANGVMEKRDWIEVHPGESYQFRITNLTGSNLKVTITYYSWK